MLSILPAVSAALGAAVVVCGPAPERCPAPVRAATVWTIDRDHSEISFRIRHLMGRVTGTFTDWSGTITADSDAWGRGSVAVTIRTASVDTRNARRDDDLRSSDFFDAKKYPELTFRSTSVQMSGTQLWINGDLTMKGVTRPIVIEGEFLGAQGSGARRRVGFHAATRINRLDWGITWNRAVEGGGVLLGDDVVIELSVEATPAG
jgi:polyisoprenoid-binding protein YceI